MADLQQGFIRLTKKALIIYLMSFLIFGGAGLGLMFLKAKTVEAVWLDDNWTFRKPISISAHTAAETNVYIVVALDTATLITAGQLQSDCGDLRYTKTNGEILPYYIVSGCNSGSTSIDVLFDSFPAGAQTIYYYYGNPAAANGTEAADFATQAANYTVGSTGSEEKSTGPVSYWKFDEGYGTTTSDSTSTAATATFAGTQLPTWKAEDLCASGKCLFFTGASILGSKLTVSDSDRLSFTDNKMSISAWVRPQSLGASAAKAIVSKQALGNGNREYGLYIVSRKIEFRAFQTDQSYVCDAIGSTTLTGTSWYFITATADGSTCQVYLNGQLEGSASISGTMVNSTSGVTIGQDNVSTSTFFGGMIDEVKIYNYDRSAAQVKLDYLNGLSNQGAQKGASAALGSNPEKFLSDSLVGYWKMDESSWNGTSNEAIESSGNVNHGTASCAGAGCAVPSTGTGKFGNAGSFTGASYGNTQYVTMGNVLDMTASQSFTVSAWAKYSTQTSDNNTPNIVAKGNTQTNPINYSLRISTTDNIPDFNINDGTNGVRVRAPSAKNDNTWHHYVGVVDRTSQTVSFYVDGVLQASSSSSSVGSLSNSNSLIIGAREGDDGIYSGLTGSVDETRIYNRALSSAEVTALYNFAPGLTGYWNFEEGSSTSANDISGNANTGAITAGTGGFTSGKFGKGYNFDNADTLVNAGSGSTLDNLPASGMSAGAWIYPKGQGENGTGFIVAKNVGTTPSSGWILQMAASNALTFTVDGSTDLVRTTSTSAVTQNAWNHVVMTWDGVITTASSVHIYVNGIEASYATTTNGASRVSDASSTLYIGNDSTSAATFNGLIDEVRIYNYVRTNQQVVSDMNAGHPSVGSPVGSALGWWKFDEGYSTTANNSGSLGSTANGTLTQMASPATSTSGWTQAGQFGKGLLFDGTNDYVNVPDAASLRPGSSDWTTSLWFKAANSNQSGTLIAKRLNSGSFNQWGITVGTLGSNGSLTASKKLSFALIGTNGTSDWIAYNTTNNIVDGNWHQVIVTRIGSSDAITMYIDGANTPLTLVTSNGTIPHNISNTQPWTIGFNNGSSYFTGTIDEVKIYNFALTADDVKKDYNQSSALVLGALSDNSSYQKQAANQEYCVPGDTTSCTAPVGRWDFEEGSSSTVNDSSGNANTGTWNGTGTTHWTNGKIGKAGNFNGSDDYVNIPNASSLTGTGSHTIEAWIKYSSNPANTKYLIKKDNDGGTGGWGMQLTQSTSGTLTCSVVVTNPSTVQKNSPAVSVSANQWHHISCIWTDGVSVKIYVDGVDSGTTTTTDTTLRTSDQPSGIGRDSTAGTTYFTGQIDQVKIFNYARTAAQVAWDYNRGGPIGWWKLDECQGSTNYDSSGNSYNGTITIGASGSQTAAGTCLTPTDGTGAWYNGRTGKLNYSLSFDGTDDFVNLGQVLPTSVATSFTFAAWVNPASAGAGTWRTIIGTHTSFAEIAISSGNQFNCGQNGGGGFFDAVSTVTITNGSWYHVACAYDGSNLKTYINGRLEKSSTSRTFTNASHGVSLLGRYQTGGGEWMNGQIDDAKIYNYALNATQIKTLYSSGAVVFGPTTGAP